MMQDIQQDSSRKSVTVEKLLELKRFEKPDPVFWDEFDREFKQKQLQALMRPSRWQKIRTAVSVPDFSLLAPVSAAAILFVAIGLVAFSFLAESEDGMEVALAEGQTDREIHSVTVGRGEAADLVAGVDESVVVAEVESLSSPASDPRFVEVVLRPESPDSAPDSFRTFAETETFTGASDSSAFYVVNAFTVDPGGLSEETATAF